MTENETPSYDEIRDASTDTSLSHVASSKQSRRRLLQTLTSGGTFLLAGCGQSDSGMPGDNGTDVSDQTLRLPERENDPAKTTLFQQVPTSVLNTAVKEEATGKLESMIWEPGIWLDGLWVLGEFHYNWIDEIAISPTEVTITIGDDVKWSDGHQITGRDIAVGPLVAQINSRVETLV